MKGTLVALAVAVCLSTPAFAQFDDIWRDHENRVQSQPNYAEEAQRNIDWQERWHQNQYENMQRNQEHRRQEWNRWQDNMRSDDGRSQSWDTPYYDNW